MLIVATNIRLVEVNSDIVATKVRWVEVDNNCTQRYGTLSRYMLVAAALVRLVDVHVNSCNIGMVGRSRY